ncbi:MAG: helix-turn-helix transcriptional regulator [Acidobacteriota bacterium]
MPVFDGLGKALRWLRAKQDKRQYQVAESASITKAMLSAYETGKQKPSLETLEKIMEALGVDLADLHDALLIVTERKPYAGMARRGAGPSGDVFGEPSLDVYRILSVDRLLPPEQEQAFLEMLRGFHRLMRFMHHSMDDSRDNGDPED